MQLVNGKIETVEKGVISTNSDLTNSTFEVLNMAKESLPNSNSISKTCIKAGCDRTAVARRLCNKHYRQAAIDGSLNSYPKTEPHGLSKNPLYSVWSSMLNRCYNPNNHAFDRYGGRGITVCERWRVGEDGQHPFVCFLEDVGERPSGFTLDRRNNNLGYSPTNCLWVDATTQANNTRQNWLITLNGRTQTAAEWCRERGMDYKNFHCRVKRGYSIERSLDPTHIKRKRRRV